MSKFIAAIDPGTTSTRCLIFDHVGNVIAINELLMQFQSDILDVLVIRPKVSETTALVAAYAAGLAVGFRNDHDELRASWGKEKEWHPAMDAEQRKKLYSGWKKPVTRMFDWVE